MSTAERQCRKERTAEGWEVMLLDCLTTKTLDCSTTKTDMTC